MNKGLRILGSGAAIWSRRTLLCSPGLAAPINAGLQTQTPLYKVCVNTHHIHGQCRSCFTMVFVGLQLSISSMLQATCESALQQHACHRSFASSSDKKVDSALDQAMKSKDAHKLLEASTICVTQ